MDSFLILSSHLPQAPCDKFVYDFPCGFGGIVGGSELRHMIVFKLSTSIVRFLVQALGGRPGEIRKEAAQRLYGNCAISVELLCSLRSLQTVIVQSLCGFRAEAARRWYDDRGATVPCHFLACGLCAVLEWGSSDATYDMSTDLRFFKFL